jgi:type II secretory pathway pseudopilin PulG
VIGQSVNRMNPRSGGRAIGNQRQQGYILLTLMLVVALMVITMAAVLPSITTQIRRDREQELIHRGAQYARAIKRYYKKFGNYPVTLDRLNSTNNIRFLRKRYKDPITGQDFRLLRYGDVQLSLGQGGFQANVVGGAQAGSGLNAPQAQSSSPFSSPFGSSAQGAQSSSPFSSPSASSSQSPFAPGASPAGASQQGPGGAAMAPAAAGGAPSAGAGSTPQDTSQGAAPAQNSPGSSPGTSSSAGSASTSPSSQGGAQGQTFGGGGIIGVASTSPKKSFHVFNNKDHYKDWAFVYDPGSDRGNLITGPYNGPPTFGTGTGQIPGAQTPGQMQPGSSGSGSTPQTPSSSPFSQSPSTSPFSQSPSAQP